MGNVMNMGYGAATDTSDGKTPVSDDYIQRLSSQDLKRYTEGFRRVCRVENASASPSSSSSPDGIGRGHPPLPAPSTLPRSAATSTSAKPRSTTSGAVNPVGSSIPSAIGLTKKLFRSKLLSAFPLIPHSLSDRLFEVLDSDQRGELSVEHVLRGIALLKCGTQDEYVQLLFAIYDLDRTGLVARDVLDRFMDVIYGRKKARRPATVAFLNRLFGRRSTLTFDEFAAIVKETDPFSGEALLMRWLFVLADKIGRDDDDKIVALEKQYNPVVIRHRIAESTQFSIHEVATLEKQFHKLFDTKGGASDRIPSDQFIDVLARNEFPRAILTRVCDRGGLTIQGLVLFDEFCTFLSRFCRGDPTSKCHHLFELYHDSSGNDESQEASKALSKAAMKELLNECKLPDALDDTLLTPRNDQSFGDHECVDENEIVNGTPDWDAVRFVAWASTSSIVQQVLHQMAFAACILFGIKPESSYLEKRIVRWHWREATKLIQVGQSWNFIAPKWWEQWCRFADMDNRCGAPDGSLLLPQLPREACMSTTNGPSLDGDEGRMNASREPSTRPGPIANWGLLKRSGSRRLKEKLVVGRDFYLVPSTVYTMLAQWYSGGPDLSRTIVELPNAVLQLELFPLVLRVARVDSANGGVVMSGEEVLLSSLSTVDTLLQATCKALLLTKHVERSRLWYFDENHPEHKYRLRAGRPKELQRLTQSSVFLLEIQDEDGSWPLSQADDSVAGGSNRHESDVRNTSSRRHPQDPKSTPSPQRRTSDICSRGNLESLTALGSTKNSVPPAAANGSVKPIPPGAAIAEDEGLATARTLKRRFSRGAFLGSGLVGLDNLGNTCYMSSALQCLSHTRLLVDYFKNEEYLHDINLRNRDGTNGKLAVAFGELLRVLWTSDKKRFAPTELKRVIAKFNPQFTGNDQHDAQELLACLLSALSEDLNRIVTKPYIEQPDSDGRCDSLVADEWWRNHLKRELSVIVALFTGQYKSLLECSVCHFESARFEPFTFLQLSLPESSYRSITVVIIFNNGRVPLKYSVRVKHHGTIADVVDDVVDLIRRLNARDRIQSEQISVAMARTSNLHTVETILDNKMPLVRVHERDQLTAYELDPLPEDRSTTSAMTIEQFTGGGDTKSAEVVASVNKPHFLVEDDTEEETDADETPDSPPSAGNSPAESDRQTTISEQENESPVGGPKRTSLSSLSRPSPRDELSQVDHWPLPLGTSVYVRTDKTNEFTAARVIGGNSAKWTIDVAYPSGVRRYHIPQAKIIVRRQDEVFVFLVHRRVERSMNSFTEAHLTRLFGAPLALRVSLRSTTNYDLYLLVWQRLHRIFNWKTPPSIAELTQSLSGRDTTDEALRTDISQLALGVHLAMTRFGFCLRMVTSHGIGCSRCEWIEGCIGCVITPSPTQVIELAADETISIDWDIRTLKEEYDPIQASKLDVDDSVQANHRLDNMPLNIDRCLDIFTAKETIQEAYCGRCKAHRPATKAMDFWRLPPILVIQLKRFCYTQTSRRKLHHLVDFPLQGLSLDSFVAKRRLPKRMHESGLTYWLFLGGKLKPTEVDSPVNGTTGNGGDHNAKFPQSPTSLLDAPATAAERDRSSLLYDLYAVVNHVGALGAGHYFAYVLSEEDQKWKCFNDHQCKDIDAKEVVSPSAYILFYRRRDVRDVAIEDLFPPIRRVKSVNVDGDEDTMSADQATVEQLVEQTKIATTSNGSTCVIS